MHRAGLLTEECPPTPAEEAVRDLCRARDDAREDLQRSRHRLGKLLLRRGLHYGGRNWTRGHRQWIDSLVWEHEAEHHVVEDYLLAIDHLEGPYDCEPVIPYCLDRPEMYGRGVRRPEPPVHPSFPLRLA